MRMHFLAKVWKASSNVDKNILVETEFTLICSSVAAGVRLRMKKKLITSERKSFKLKWKSFLEKNCSFE